ncbi:hypothetical protein TL16_g04784 [Triparma laevis f. inornata]|uniref:Uncharacterized protein n=1 Tax=Triparma laevis f. inornata TaxID=1714386 RepID=A0A9W7ACG2_9STRA|nr:hypothetical protein TL16_g04784 [Triparma laevis f. inornata]
MGLPLYQPHPIANAFTFDPSEAHRPCQPSSTGGISRVMDKGINKLVYRIRGSVPSSNFLEPNKKVSDLCLTGNYIYIVTKKLSSQPLTMHLDFVSAKNHTFRISISSFFETPRMAGTSTLRIPFSYFSPDGASSPPWTVVALDVRATVKKFSPEAFANDRVSHLRTLKVCSHATLYGAFTSDICYDMESLCKCISVSTQPELMRWLPSKPKQLQKASVKKAKKGSKAEEMDENAPTQMKIRVSASKKRDLPVPPAPTPLSPQSNNGNGRTDNPEANPLISPPIPPRPQAKIAVKGASVLKKISEPRLRSEQRKSAAKKLTPSPLTATGSPPIPPRRPRPTKPTRLIGCGGTVDNLSWSKSDTALTFPCSNCVVTMETPRVDDGEGPNLDALLSQETISTSSLINLSAISPSSALLATASSKELKVYDAQRGACLASVVILNETEGMPVPLPPVSLSFSIDEQLVAVCHYDAQRRQCITVFSLTGLLEQLEKTTENLQKGVVQKTLPLVAKQTSDFPISAIKFTPYDSKKLVSCGKENVRFWRIKSSHLPACPAILNEFARNTVFTDLAFESSYGMLDDTDTPKIVFAATSLGTLLQISYHSRTVLCVLKLHDGPINTVAVNEGYAVTGSDDKYLRLWPLDFSDFLLEAQHDAPVTKISLSLDGLKLLVGTGSGTIGVLDVVTQSYATVMRSHASGILSLASDFERKEFASVGQDKTIRVWSSVNGRQKYEFLSPHDTPTCVAYHPNSQTIVCGFDSGYVRVFDVVTTSTLHELEQHTGVVKSLIFSKDGNIVYTVATDGHISMFDVTQEYLPLKTVACDVPADGCMLALSPDGSQLVAPGPEKNAITLYDAQTLVPIRKMVYKRGEVMEECPFEYIAFAGEDVVVAFTKSRVVYFSKGGKLASDQLPGQGGGAFAQSADGRFFACDSKESSGDLKSNFVYIWKHGGNGRIGGGVVKEVKRCGGMWSGVTALEFSDDDKTLLASDETGVTYVWDLGDMGSEDEDEKEGWVVIEEEEGESLSPRASIKALSLDEQPTAIMTPRSSDTKAAIKALSASPVVETPKTPMRADRVMSLVLNEMLKRSWISASTAAIMASPACPELPILLAAVEAFSINQDFDELLDTFLMTSKHIVAAEAEAEKEKEEVEDLDEDEESSVDEDVTEIPSLSPFLTRHTEKAEKSLPPALPAGPFGLLRVLGGVGTALLWAPSNGLIAYSAGNTCVLEDLESQQQWLAQHDAASTVQCLAMTDDCNIVASGSAEGGRLCLRVWAREGDEMKAVHAEGVLDKTGVDTLALVFSEMQVVAGGVEGFVVFDLLQGRVVWQTQAASMDSIAALSANTFVTGGSSGLTLWREAERGLDSEKIELAGAHNRVSSVSVSPDGRYIVAGNTAGGLEIWSVEAGEVVDVFDDAVMGAVAFVEAKQNKLVVSNGKLIAGYEIEYGEEGVKIDKEGGVVTSVKAGVVAMQWDESGEEGVVGTSGGGVKYLELGSHEEIDLIKPLTGLEKCAKSSDDKFFAAVGGEEIVVFSVEEGAGLKELCRIAVGYDAASVKCTNVAFGCPPGAKDSRILVAAAFSNCKVKVLSADTVKIGEFSVCEASLERSRAIRKGLASTDDGCYNLAFVDDDGHLATGGSDGELLLTPIAYNASGKVILRQETFDLLEHQKSESGEFVDGDVDWRWTAVEAHPRDPSTWCCSKLKVGAESTKPQAHVYLFQNGQNTHTISVLDVFTEANNPVPNPTFFSTKFSLSRPGFLQCSLGQGDSSCVVTFNMLDPSGVPKVDSIVQLDETCVRRMGLSSTGIMAAVADESVVLMKEKGEPIQCIDVGGLGGDAEITEDGTCIFSVGKDGVAVFNLKG